MQFPREEQLIPGSERSCHPLLHAPLPGLKLHCGIVMTICLHQLLCLQVPSSAPSQELSATHFPPPAMPWALSSSFPALPWPCFQRRPASKDSAFRPPELLKFISSVMPSGTESLNFTRDAQRCCQPRQLTPASPADSPSVDAGGHQVRMLLCSQVTVPRAQGRGRSNPSTGDCLEASGNQNASQEPSNKITVQNLSSPFKPLHLRAVLAFTLMH